MMKYEKDKKTLLIYPGFVGDTWCSIEQRYLWLDAPLRKYFNVYWLVPPTGSRYTRYGNEENRYKEPIYVTHLKQIGANIIEADISKYNIFRNVFLLKKILKTYKIEAVTQFFSPLGYYLEIVARIIGINVIRKEHTFTFHKSRKYTLIKWLFWKYTTDYYVSVSRSVENHLKTKRLIKNNSYVVYDGFDIDTFPKPNQSLSREELMKEFKLPFDSVIVSCIAKIDKKQKQQHILLEMLYKLNDKRIILFLAGNTNDKEYKKTLITIIKKYGLEKNVIFTGYRFDIPKIIDASEITYLPSSWEGIPNAVIESFIMYTPVIASDIPPVREIIDDNINGFCIKDNNHDEYYKRTFELLNNKEKRKKFGIDGRTKVENLFSKETFISESIKSFQKAFEYFDA